MKALYVVFFVRVADNKVESYSHVYHEEDIVEEKDQERAMKLVAEVLKIHNLNMLNYCNAGVHKLSRKIMEEALA